MELRLYPQPNGSVLAVFRDKRTGRGAKLVRPAGERFDEAKVKAAMDKVKGLEPASEGS